jgi:hypothetical protein
VQKKKKRRSDLYGIQFFLSVSEIRVSSPLGKNQLRVIIRREFTWQHVKLIPKERLISVWWEKCWCSMTSELCLLVSDSSAYTGYLTIGLGRKVQGYSKWLSGFQQLVIHNTLEIGVYVFLYLIEQHTKFVTYLAGALYVRPLWFYKHQHYNVSTRNAFSLPFAAILVNCAPSGKMHNYYTLHIIKGNYEFFLQHRSGRKHRAVRVLPHTNPLIQLKRHSWRWTYEVRNTVGLINIVNKLDHKRTLCI